MSRKGTDEPSAARIRDNQRRSRARRKDLIEDLQRRVHAYEQKGVAATLEMQQAARKVAQENARLRGLLAQMGVSTEQVDAYVRTFDDARGSVDVQAATPRGPGQLRESSLALDRAPLRCETRPLAGVDACQPSPAMSEDHVVTQQRAHESQDDPSSARSHVDAAVFPPDSNSHYAWASPPTDATDTPPMHDNGTASANNDNDNNDNNVASLALEAPDCPNTATCFCAPTAPPPPAAAPPPHKSSLEISCDAAASIIAGMRSSSHADSDREAIRASLGCVDNRECHIKNSTVLQLMDDS